MSKTDIPGVIAPPPLIYLGFLFIGWGLAELGARPAIIEAGFGWLAVDLGLAIEVRRGVALALIIGGLLLDGMAAGLFRRRGTAVEPWKPSTVLIDEGPYRFSRNPIYLGGLKSEGQHHLERPADAPARVRTGCGGSRRRRW